MVDIIRNKATEDEKGLKPKHVFQAVKLFILKDCSYSHFSVLICVVMFCVIQVRSLSFPQCNSAEQFRETDTFTEDWRERERERGIVT